MLFQLRTERKSAKWGKITRISRSRKLLRSVSYEDGVRRQSKRWEEDRSGMAL